jgi:arylsulfatase
VEQHSRRPNVLLVVTDQERHRGWIPDELVPPNRRRLIDSSVELQSHYVHSSPCSPARATLFTGRYVPGHGVYENTILPGHPQLDPSVRTIGHVLRDAGYYTAYLGKWHLTLDAFPDMEAYGFSDWSGNDGHWMGLAGTGAYFDPIIAQQAARWIGDNAGGKRPWFLTVALVNPHDVAWFPADQPWYDDANRRKQDEYREFLHHATAFMGRGAPYPLPDPIPRFETDYEEIFDLPASFDDDLFTKPPVQRQWNWEDQHGMFGHIGRDERAWRRCLDYYYKLHHFSDQHIGTVLDALAASGQEDDTIVVFTSDHGEMAGSHGIRGKGPFVYEDAMRVPLTIRAPGVTRPGTKSKALSCHVDVARTIVSLTGASPKGLAGYDLTPILRAEQDKVRDAVLFALDQPWFQSCIPLRYACRGFCDGRVKYARWFGVGGGIDIYGKKLEALPDKRFGVDAAFEEHDHEWYDLSNDPDEVMNLANDRARRSQLREWFHHLKELEARELARGNDG